jgi:eukaryotic-like serine/threonine-protein kinase
MTLPDRQRWARLSPLLEELLELDVRGRRARLAELRARNGAVAGQLEALIDADGRAEGSHFLTGDAQGENVAAATIIGERVGAYLIEAPLGQGGTGSVRRAPRGRPLRRRGGDQAAAHVADRPRRGVALRA